MEFQYDNKRHVTTEHTLFKLNFERHPWKVNLIIKTELPKLENFLEKLQGSWEAAKKLMEITKKAMKKQFDKKRKNL